MTPNQSDSELVFMKEERIINKWIDGKVLNTLTGRYQLISLCQTEAVGSVRRSPFLSPSKDLCFFVFGPQIRACFHQERNPGGESEIPELPRMEQRIFGLEKSPKAKQKCNPYVPMLNVKNPIR